MDQFAQLKIEFFELVRLCNKSNLNLNQKTEISFFIETDNQKSILYATTNKTYKIQLISKSGDNPWHSCEFSGLINLEVELGHFFNTLDTKKISPAELTKLIKSRVFKYFD